MKIKIFLKNFFFTRPYKFIFIIDFFIFSLSILNNNYFPKNIFYSNLISLTTLLITFFETIYFLRFYKKSKIQIFVKILSSQKKENELTRYILNFWQKLLNKFFFLLWSSLPVLISFFLTQTINSINFTSWYEKLFLSIASSFFITIYLKSVEKITTSKEIEFLSNGIVSITSIFMFYLSIIFIFNKFWIVNFSFKTSFLLVSIMFWIVNTFLLARIGTIKDFIYSYFYFIVFELFLFFSMKKIQDFRSLAFCITTISFVIINFQERKLNKTLNFTLLLLYVLLIIGIFPILGI